MNNEKTIKMAEVVITLVLFSAASVQLYEVCREMRELIITVSNLEFIDNICSTQKRKAMISKATTAINQMEALALRAGKEFDKCPQAQKH